MQISYGKDNIFLEITIDYCQKDAMESFCELLTSLIGDDVNWLIEGRFMNHALDEKDILSARKNLVELFREKNMNMNVKEKDDFFQRDTIMLTTMELIKYFSDFSIYYMEIIIKPQITESEIIEFGTDSDADFIHIKIKFIAKSWILLILQYIGVDKLKKVKWEKCNVVWKDNVFEDIKNNYPEINNYNEMLLLRLRNAGWIKVKEHIEKYFMKRERKIIYHLAKESGDYMEIPVFIIRDQYNSLELKTVTVTHHVIIPEKTGIK